MNTTHAKMLLAGVEKWNAWRAANPEIRPDLTGADLAGADLAGANLAYANLSLAYSTENPGERLNA